MQNESFIINFKTISENGKISGYKAEQIRIRQDGDKDWMEISAIVCITKNQLSLENEYQALLSRGII